jgi:hypothetical protein
MKTSTEIGFPENDNTAERLLVYGFGDLKRASIDKISKWHGFSSVYWISENQDADYSIFSLINCTAIRDLSKVQLCDTDKPNDFFSSERWSCVADSVTRIYHRHYKQASSSKPFFREISHFCAVLVARLTRIILDQGISWIIFSNLPHEGPDILLAEIARTYSIKTVSIHQPLPIRFFCQLVINYTLDQVDSTHFETDTLRIQMPEETIDPDYLHEEIHRSCFAQYYMPNCAQQNAQFLTHGHTARDFNIYFPLHLQPELTTDILASRGFTNQVAAIIQLLSYCRKDTRILLKPNPKSSTHGFDDQEVLDIFSDHPQIEFLDTSFPSQDALVNSKCVATITGSIGYEAIHNGIPAIYFGLPWWKSMNGAHNMKDLIQDIAISGNSLESIIERARKHMDASAKSSYTSIAQETYWGSPLPISDGGSTLLMKQSFNLALRSARFN